MNIYLQSVVELMHKKGLEIMSVVLALVIATACLIPLTENASNQSFDDHRLADKVVTIRPQDIDENSSILELVLSYEQASAEKRYYESKGMEVEFYNPMEYISGTFKGDLIREMNSKLHLPMLDNADADRPLEPVKKDIIPKDDFSDRSSIPISGIIDLEFLEEVITFVENRSDRIECCLSELTSALHTQQETLLKVKLMSAYDDLFCVDLRSLDKHKQSMETQQFQQENLIEDDSETELDIQTCENVPDMLLTEQPVTENFLTDTFVLEVYLNSFNF